LEELLLDHFNADSDTRAMVFVQWRDSVSEIVEMLAKHSPQIRAMPFVGQGTGKSGKGLTQKEQQQVIKTFREGGYNTLIATCIGEEVFR
jgi:Fanconi anemia group M protein